MASNPQPFSREAKPRAGAGLTLHLGLILLTAWQVSITTSFYLANRFFTQDAANIDYMLYYTWHGRFFWSLVVEAPHFSKHFTPTLLALVPFHALSRHPLFLPVAETLAVMSGAWAVAWLFDGLLRKGRGARLARLSPIGLALGWLYAANPHTGSILLAFHFESFAAALSLWALAALANRRLALFWVLLGLALGVKEDIALYWGAFGLWWIVFGWRDGKRRSQTGKAAEERSRGGWRGRLRRGLAILSLCAAWALAAMLVIRWTAQASGQTGAEYSPRYAWLGQSLGERAASVVSSARYLFFPLRNAAYLLLPATLLLPLLAPSTLLLLAPGAYLMGLSDVDSQYALYYYYSYPFLPFLFLGAALGLVRLERWSRALTRGKRRAAAACAIAAALALAGCFLLVRPTRTDHLRRVPLRPEPRHSWIRAMLRERIPPEASVAAQFDLLAQVPYRTRIYPLSEKNLDRAEYWVFDLRGFRGDVSAAQLRAMLGRAQSLVGAGKAQVVVDGEGLLIVRRPRK